MLRWVVAWLATAISLTAAASSASLPCGACMLIAHEIEVAIRAVDPKKVVDAGSFRVNPKGEQVGLKQVSFARSNAHIVEQLEGVCGKSSDYKHVVNKLTGKKVYVNKALTWEDGDESATMRSKLHGACNDLIDEHEETLEKFFQKEMADPAKELCFKKIGVCSSVDVSPMPPSDPPRKEEEEANDEL